MEMASRKLVTSSKSHSGDVWKFVTPPGSANVNPSSPTPKKKLEVKSWIENSKNVDLLADSDSEFEEVIEEEEDKEEEHDLEYFDTFLDMEKLGYHEWHLKNPRPSWVKAKIGTGNLNNVKFSCMIGHFVKKQAYIDLESPINMMSRLHYKWIMSNRLESRKKPSNPKKICNLVGRVRDLNVFVGHFTYECDFVVLDDTTSVIDHYLGSVVFGKPFVKRPDSFMIRRKERSCLRRKEMMTATRKPTTRIA
nr:protein kinase-like domain, concanavalin A-like lectin/glucanase domain protein [Tanacetum cinerariifolium]